jgi:hypothetical protein
MWKLTVYHNKARFRALASRFRPTTRHHHARKSETLCYGWPVFSLAVLAIAIVAVLTMAHFR